ncbi:hypothetical protein D3Z36_08405 [Lachnospiraceae bacterium]|nr:hypothetical protein [Lachnospiraceae bacterium]
MSKQVEYEMLREEILFSMQTVKNYRTLLYSIVIAVLAFAFDKGEAILFLLPFVAVIPLYLLAMHQIDSTMRLGAYIYVFIEPGTECQWETRLNKYDFLHRNQYSTKKSSIDPYWYLSFCCLLLSVLKLDFCNRDVEFYVTAVTQIIILISCIYLFIKKRPDYLTTKEKYIREWKEIQRMENREDE